ncbi:MAG: LacI family transcriptional regulator, partial [Fibrobacter sp.]|nr:LacI family transcriptional regulator [Fibrobacter sp.]
MKKRPFRVAFLADNLYIHYCHEVWAGVYASARDAKIELLTILGGSLNNPNYYLADRNFIYDRIRIEDLDGIIVNSGSVGNYSTEQQLLDYFTRFAPLPLVNIGLKLDNYHSVIVDNKIGMKELVNHFIQVHGYRRIGFIRGPEGSFDAEVRFDAYKEALQENNIEIDYSLVSPGNFEKSSGIKAVSFYLDYRRTLPDAIVAANDDMAIAAMTEFSMRGVSIPIGGFDNNLSSLSYYPPLTTVQQPIFQLGKQALEIMNGLLIGDKPPMLTTFKTSIVIRRSCGCFYESNQSGMSSVNEITNADDMTLTELLNTGFPSISNSLHNPDWAEELVSAMKIVMENHLYLDFLKKIELLIIESLENHINIADWFNCFSFLFKKLASGSKDNDYDFILEFKTRIFAFIGNKGVIHEISKRNILDDESNYFQFMSNSLITTFELQDLEQIFSTELPKFRIKYFYLLLMDQKEPDKLHLLYYLNRYLDISFSKSVFDFKNVFSEVLFRNLDHKHSIIMPLYYQNQKQGLIISDTGTMDGNFYENLLTQI